MPSPLHLDRFFGRLISNHILVVTVDFSVLRNPYFVPPVFFLFHLQLRSSLIIAIMDEGQSADGNEDIHQIKLSKTSKSNRRNTKGKKLWSCL
ncbi:uncharacterized protein [Medicago truncatula]|uniref:uncharacterized protein isoform X2 n=1 Tax=Medicago truncatula TaxID=3880 RepID=UPI0019671428|nr:uncharacterized protein LOC120580909 isoform X2 [Medicago truncatula]